ncbi:hypothetical protein PR202_ga03783 [Eleusine coracana subsp. coracana]|uniref:Uncharacterized protein n=1 Tax=Eleusine coracana subsp. coracana TaxID=191504 RepID=A0AAV5BPW6_ELECO|nr:hypothetical protein PR202_ga03783 [Eleusine coracana subsp. coracana]
MQVGKDLLAADESGGCSKYFLDLQSGKEVALKLWAMDSEVQLKIVTWLWRWWAARNKTNAAERRLNAMEVCSSVDYHCSEFAKLKARQGLRFRQQQTEEDGAWWQGIEAGCDGHWGWKHTASRERSSCGGFSSPKWSPKGGSAGHDTSDTRD